MYQRETIVKQMQAWIGAKQGDATHKKIIDTYNGHKPLARGYKVKYTDAWCATTVSAAAIACGYTAIIPTECGCEKMIALCKAKGIWVENDAYTPKPGDIIFYDWEDSGAGDCQGNSDHVGIVESISGGIISVIEGNKNKAVGRRSIMVNGKYIRGYAVPKYTEEKKAETLVDIAKIIWDFLMGIFGNAFGVAGLMGNLKAESGLIPTNLQNSYEKKLGMNDAQYVAAVDAGTYNNFVRDAAGFGLAQWTYWSRKQNLLTFAKSKGKSIGDLNMQLEFLVNELKGYKTVYDGIKNAKSVKAASDIVLTQFERPADQSDAVKNTRAKYGQEYYDKYAKKAEPVKNNTEKIEPAAKKDAKLSGAYKTTANLNVRAGAGTDKKILVTIPTGTTVNNYGYYTDVAGVKWLYVQFTYNGTQYTGYCSSKYLKK